MIQVLTCWMFWVLGEKFIFGQKHILACFEVLHTFLFLFVMKIIFLMKISGKKNGKLSLHLIKCCFDLNLLVTVVVSHIIVKNFNVICACLDQFCHAITAYFFVIVYFLVWFWTILGKLFDVIFTQDTEELKKII